MSNDYTLPPLPLWSYRDHRTTEVKAYGHACAEHARAPLAEENTRLLWQVAGLEGRNEALAEMNQHQASVIDRFRAEVEALRAASVIEWEPGRSYTAAELLRRAIRGIRGRKSRSICPAVENLFGCGNTVARYLCRWAGRDPDTGKDIAARKGAEGDRLGEGSEG